MGFFIQKRKCMSLKFTEEGELFASCQSLVTSHYLQVTSY